jgi:short subunit dehydrogenase-like uncharacterized protein
MDKNYDIILFGFTGFTGKLAFEYLCQSTNDIKWAVSARNATKKVTKFMQDIAGSCGVDAPPLLEADLVCETSEQEDILRDIVRQTKVVITCAGPFEKYGQTLVKLCAEEGVSYADITGESDFFRAMIDEHDKTAVKTGAVIVCHCGNDCVPQDLTVFEMNKYAKENDAYLSEVRTYTEVAESASFSGGTSSTAIYQMSKDRSKSKANTFDPLLRTVSRYRSSCE